MRRLVSQLPGSGSAPGSPVVDDRRPDPVARDGTRHKEGTSVFASREAFPAGDDALDE
ncbi:MAG: hypothetical protein KDA24_15410 [Deltaproteobacteria bacterium]|nr:hypothetical protein [Deltaproteobacteria bacterium]